MADAVFAYGSLVGGASAAQTLGPGLGPPLPARLEGWRRRWCVARDNRECEKTFAEAHTGRVPDVVLCLGVERLAEAEGRDGGPLNGALIALQEPMLALLDARELRYRRIDVTADVRSASPAAKRFERVFAYEPRPRHHVAEPPAGSVILAPYLAAVEAAFSELGGEQELSAFRRSTPLPAVDVIEARLMPGSAPAKRNPSAW